MNRFIHHFTIAEIGSLVTYRSHPDPDSFVELPILLTKIGIIKAIENRLFDQLLTVDFNVIFRGLGSLWKISGDDLAPLPQWIINGDGKTSLIASSIRSGGTPSAYVFANPPTELLVSINTYTNLELVI